jgi:hypothetical protein
MSSGRTRAAITRPGPITQSEASRRRVSCIANSRHSCGCKVNCRY